MTTSQHSDLPPIDPRRLVHNALDVLWRHRARIAIFFSGTMALIVIGLVVCPRTYESEAKLFVRVGRENIGIDPTATTGQTMPLQDSRENEITSVLDILQSRVVLEGVVDRLGPHLILDGKVSQQPADLLLREKAIRHLNSTVRTSHTKKSNVLGISYRDRSPELAQRILKTFVDEFQTVHIRANRTSGSFEFFDDQAELLRAQFETASEKLNAAKDSINAVSVEQRRAALQNHLSSIEAEQLQTQAELHSVNGSIVGLEQTLADLPQKALTQEVTGFPDDAIGMTRKQVHQLEIEEQQLLTQFTERHPQIIALRRQLEAARSLLQNPATSGSQATSADNPAFQQLQLKKLELDSHQAGLQAKLDALQQQFAQIKTQLQTLNARETQIAELQQRVDLFRDKYTTYSEKLEQARIDQALESERISNVNVVQPPSFVAKPVSPRKALTLIIGFLFASAGSVCFALLTEYWRRPLSDSSAAAAAAPSVKASSAPGTQGIAASVSEVEQLVETARY